MTEYRFNLRSHDSMTERGQHIFDLGTFDNMTESELRDINDMLYTTSPLIEAAVKLGDGLLYTDLIRMVAAVGFEMGRKHVS